MIRQIILYISLFNVCFVATPAQELVIGLQSNSVIVNTRDKQVNAKSMTSDTLELPFFDDFSGLSILPDSKMWLDDFVFINNTYSDKQITSGIATMDALDNAGRLYETASSEVFEADKLTSQPINLNYPASEDIWLSFLYQSGGLADTAELNDSITLQFLAPDESIWYSVWKSGGTANGKFKPVIIDINDPRYLKRGFQFRFINYASLSSNLSDPSMVGNCDLWNIDYVLLDRSRNEADTIFADVAFTLPVRSLLKTHEAMPWKQFQQVYLQEMGSSINIIYRNNDTITRNVTRNFEIWDVYKNSQSHFFSAGATNIDPLANVDYNADLVYTFDTDNSDSALFRITSSLKTDEFDPKANDTLVYFQSFQNFFAFDDGSSEGGYGINGLGSRNAMVAYRFVSFMEDTLRAIRICFNDSYLNANQRSFDLMVWDDNNGIPGNAIYSMEEVMVEQEDLINGFYTYVIPEGVMVNDVFYVGWKQRSETFLNAGFDINTPHIGRQFYWLNGIWNLSQARGSIMIRPVVGDPIKTTAINDIFHKERMLIDIWPNPVTDYLNVKVKEQYLSGLSYVAIIDLNGREMIKVPFSEQIDISSLNEGIFVITVTRNGKSLGYNRFIKTR